MRTTSLGGNLAALRRDKRGNTLAMAAASLIPIAAMVGSGLDASRTYLVKARLQSACDAGALAARKSMDGSGQISTTATTAGDNFFQNNFPTGLYGTTSRTFTMTLDTTQQVNGTARVRVPMTLMKMFNYQFLDLTATCTAKLDITNTDVMFVLDTTGSMSCRVDGSSCNGDGSSKIAGLRNAVVSFTNTLSGAAPASARIRYGFVPYSSTVNVGKLLQQSWLSDTWHYRSFVAQFDAQVTPVTQTETYSTPLTQSECDTYGRKFNYPDNNSGPTAAMSTDPNGFTTNGSVAFLDWGAGDTSSNTTKTCRRNKTVTVTPQAYKFSGWNYTSADYNGSAFKSGTSVPVATADPPSNYYVSSPRTANLAELAGYPNYSAMGGAVSSYAWDGCIEERKTVPNAVLADGSISSDAFDLDIDTPATSTDTSWHPAWPQVVIGNYYNQFLFRMYNSGAYACPAPARKLGVMTPGDVQTYVNSLYADGNTYHDSGMIWGSRLISSTGIFGSENAVAPNAQPISRNIVFMTDGEMVTQPYLYTLYGHEWLDQRVTGGQPNTNDMIDRHNKRYVAMCKAIQNKGVNIYVVAFGQATNAQMDACATSGKASFAANPEALKAIFNEIATKIAKLRLSR